MAVPGQYLYTSGSRVNGYGMYIGIADQTMAVEVSATMKGSQMDMYMVMDMPATETSSIVMIMEMDGTYRSTSTKPATEPPVNAVIVDIIELLASSTPTA